MKDDDSGYDEKPNSKKGDSIKQEDSIKNKKERKGSKINIEISSNDLKQDSKSEDTNEKTPKNKKTYTTDSHKRSSSELGDTENSGRSPTPSRKSNQKNSKNNNIEESKPNIYSSYDDTESTNNQNTNSSSNTTNIHISTRHSTRNTHRVNYQLNSSTPHNTNHKSGITTIKVKYPNQKASINEMNKRVKQILEYLNRIKPELQELYRKNKLNSIIQSGGKVDIKEYRSEIKYSGENEITDNTESITSLPENDAEYNGLDMLNKLCSKISKFQQDYNV